MHWQAIHWGYLLFWCIKLLKVFGIIPGALAAFGVRKLYQKWRQSQALAGWPSTDATIQSGEVHKKGWRSYWAELTYSYYVGEYRAGKYVRHFRSEEQADEFIRQAKDRHMQVHYNSSDPDKSVILDRDIEMVAMLSPEFR